MGVFLADDFVPSDAWKADAELLHKGRQIEAIWSQHESAGFSTDPQLIAQQVDDTWDRRGHYELLEARQQAENCSRLATSDLDLDALEQMSDDRRRVFIAARLGQIAGEKYRGQTTMTSSNGYPTAEYEILHALIPLRSGEHWMAEPAPDGK